MTNLPGAQKFKTTMLLQYGFGYAWVANEVGNEKIFLAMLKQRLKGCSYQIIHSDVHTSAKSIYYKDNETLLNVERYLSTDMCYKFQRRLSNFRCSGHSLMVELGRHQYIDREYRYCPICIKMIFMSWKTKCILCLFVHCMIPLE